VPACCFRFYLFPGDLRIGVGKGEICVTTTDDVGMRWTIFLRKAMLQGLVERFLRVKFSSSNSLNFIKVRR